MRPGLLFLICYHPPQSHSPGGQLRVLFLLLLLANVLFLAWTRWVVPVVPATIEAPARMPAPFATNPVCMSARSG